MVELSRVQIQGGKSTERTKVELKASRHANLRYAVRRAGHGVDLVLGDHDPITIEQRPPRVLLEPGQREPLTSRYPFRGQVEYNQAWQYLEGLLSQPANGAVVAYALTLLRRLDPNGPIPVVGIGNEENIGFSWDLDHHHLEIEVFSDGRAEYFYINHNTDCMWDDERQVIDALSPAFELKLKTYFR